MGTLSYSKSVSLTPGEYTIFVPEGSGYIQHECTVTNTSGGVATVKGKLILEADGGFLGKPDSTKVTIASAKAIYNGATKVNITSSKSVTATDDNTKTSTLGSYSVTVNKTHSTQSITYKLTAGTLTVKVASSGYSSKTGTSSCGTKSGTITIPAKETYTITYNANNGSGAPGKQTKWYGETLTLSSVKPTRTGYTFLGWDEYPFSSTATYPAGGKYTANEYATLYAIWKANIYTLTFNYNGGEITETSELSREVTYNNTYGSVWGDYILYPLPTPTREGYIFDGWYTAASGGTLVTEATKMGAADTTIYAHWTEKTASLTYDGNVHGATPESVTMSYTKETLATSAPTLIDEGWVFQGWLRSDNEDIIQPGEIVKAANVEPSDLTLTAQWVPAIYQITLGDGQDVTTHGQPSPFWGSYGNGFYDNAECTGNPITFLTSLPSKEHYDFGGYYLNEIQCIDANGIIIADSEDFTTSTTLTARWVPDIYEITLDNQQATNPGTAKYYERYEEGNYFDENCTDSIDSIVIPYKLGYSFLGYYSTSSSDVQYINNVGVIQQSNIEESRTIYAQWSINSYQLVFNGNGGSTPESRTVVFGQSYGDNENPLPIPVRPGYDFIGWYTEAIGGIQVNENTIMTTEGATVYAHWEGDKYTIDDYTYTVIDDGEVAARVAENSQYGPIPYSITVGNNTFVVTSLEGCFKNTNVSGNIYVNCSAVNNVNEIFDGVSNNVCIIFGSDFKEFSEIWDTINETYENVTYLGVEDTDYYFTSRGANNTLNIRVKDKSKTTYDLPLLSFEGGWEAVSMDKCYKDCENLQGILFVHNNPISSEEIFDGITHEVLLLCTINDSAILNTWQEIASRDNEEQESNNG